MEFQGSVAFAAAQTAVWHTLTTPDLVSQCTPRLKSWSPLAANNQFQLQFIWGSGSKNIIIPLQLTWQTMTPPTFLQWQATAHMGSTDLFLQGEFQLESAAPNQTTLTFSARVSPPNKLLGQMIQTTAPPLIENFFRCLKTTIEVV